MLPSYITLPIPFARLMDEGGPRRLCDDLAAGQTLKDIATRVGATRGALVRFISTFPADVQAEIRVADAQGSTAMVEESKTIADQTALDIRSMTKPMYVEGEYITDLVDAQAILAAEKERIRVRQWIAERKDKETWGGKAHTDITVTLASIHLDVLRKRHSATTQPITVSEPPADVSAFL